MSDNKAENSTDEKFKLRDQIGLLQYAFQDLLLAIIDTIGRISRDASINPEDNVGYPLFKYEDIPTAAENIISKCLMIDSLIDEAQESFLGKEIPEILSTLKELSDAYQTKVNSLDEDLARANNWMEKIHNVLGVVADNTPWLKQTYGNEEEEEEEDKGENENE